MLLHLGELKNHPSYLILKTRRKIKLGRTMQNLSNIIGQSQSNCEQL